MRAFHESAYGSDSVSDLMTELAQSVSAVRRRGKEEEEKYLERAEFVHHQQSKGRPMEIYYADEVSALKS